MYSYADGGQHDPRIATPQGPQAQEFNPRQFVPPQQPNQAQQELLSQLSPEQIAALQAELQARQGQAQPQQPTLQDQLLLSLRLVIQVEFAHFLTANYYAQVIPGVLRPSISKFFAEQANNSLANANTGINKVLGLGGREVLLTDPDGDSLDGVETANLGEMLQVLVDQKERVISLYTQTLNLIQGVDAGLESWIKDTIESQSQQLIEVQLMRQAI